ncbi:MAG: CARDB domain-containing protein [Poseidonia sp.]
MRTHAPTAALVLSLLLFGLPLAAAQAPNDGGTTSITGAETWTEDGHFDGHVVVVDGGSLTVNANITVATGSSITVEEGGQLVLTNGALVSDDLNAGLMVNSMFATITLNFGDLADEGVVQLKFDHIINADSKFNVTIGNETISASGQELVQFDVPLNGTDLMVSFDSYYFTPTYVLWAKAIYGGGNSETVLAQDMDASDAPLYWFQSGFDINAHGDLSITSSTVSGASIHCASLCRFDNTELVGSAPVDAATTASVAVLSSIISGSRSDEDIILHDEASIDYQNSQGTGGTTDAWIRLLTQRTLSTNIPNGSLDIYDMGWGAADWNDLTDSDGNVVLVEEGATNEHKRIVAWMDGDGMVHQEEASITLSITSSWGVFSTTINAPTTSTATVEVDLPFVEVTAVAPEAETAFANSSVSGMITVANTGAAAVSSVSIWCYEGEEIADTTNVVVSLAPGESKDVPFTWYAYTAGEATLNCRPLLPTALNDIADEVVDMNGATSPVVTWEYAVEEEDTPLLIFIAAAVGFVAVALFIAAQRRPEEKSYAIQHETYESTEDADVEETTDASEMDAEESEEAEGTEDAAGEEVAAATDDETEAAEPSTKSIYDLQPDDQ